MGLQQCDDFNSYSQTSDVLRNWSLVGSPWTWTAGAGRDGISGAMVAATTGGGRLQSTLGQMSLTGLPLGVPFWIKVSAAPSAASLLMQCENSALAGGAQLRLTTSGFPALYSNGGALLQTGITNVCDNNWHWIEWNVVSSLNQPQKCFADTVTQWNIASGGAVGTVTIDHFTVLSITGVTVTLSYILWLDDSVAQSPQTSDIPLGPLQINTQRWASDGAVQFAPDSGGSNYSRVNEVVADEDTSYVQDNVSGHADLYNVAALGFTPTKIWAVQLTTRAKNTGVGSISYKNRCKSGGTTSDGASTIAPPSYQNSRTSYNRDPNTGAAWVPANLATAQFGPTVV